jgi:hypothetical protein
MILWWDLAYGIAFIGQVVFGVGAVYDDVFGDEFVEEFNDIRIRDVFHGKVHWIRQSSGTCRLMSSARSLKWKVAV